MGECCPPTFDKHHAKFATSDMCFGSIFSTSNTKNADYIAIQMNRYIVGMDPKNVIQVCFDNAADLENAASSLAVDGYTYIAND